MGHARDLILTALDHHADECLLWPFAISGNGYPKATIDGETTAVHVFICTAEHGEPPDPGMEAAHKCGNRLCIARAHLRWKTKTENMAEVVAMGRSNRADRTWSNKLTEDQVIEIRAMAGKALHREIADLYGVSAVQVSRIINRQSWNWL